MPEYRYWTEKYTFDDNFIVFDYVQKNGEKRNYRFKKDLVQSIEEQEGSVQDLQDKINKKEYE